MAMYSKNSRIKMVCLLKGGNNHLKQNGKNPVFYSPEKYNAKPDETIIKGMIRRLQNTEVFKASNVIQFYDTVTGTLVKQI